MITYMAAALLGALRICGFKSIAFQAIAHLYVGGLFGAWLATRKRAPLLTALALTVLETLCFLLLPR